MSNFAKVISLSYDSAVATKSSALKTYYRSVRLIRDVNTVLPNKDSVYTNILLCGNCVDPETRNLYVFYIDVFYKAAWIIEINIDSRVQTVVYYDKYNNIRFDPLHKIYNARVVYGRIIWTDNKNPIYQMDVARAKKSYSLGIGYGQNEIMAEWTAVAHYATGRIVSNGNNFYQALFYNNDVEPRMDNGTVWTKLCLIEEAYYSMNIKNFYFEPIPPTHPPVVTYQSDDTRKINNLRQTLFQIAYRYVYMDWRKSTFSPASIVPVPQSEEETATGLANEQISLNNKLQISFNSGGEEVRAIEIIGRSSQDPSKWFLIDTINKFDIQERNGEISGAITIVKVMMALSIPAPTVISTSAPEPEGIVPLGMSIPTPTAFQSYVRLSESDFVWRYDEYYPLGVKTVRTTVILSHAVVTSLPSWLTVFRSGVPLSLGDNVTDGNDLDMFPTVENKELELTGVFTITDANGDMASLAVKQTMNYAGITVSVSASTPPPLIITDNGCTGVYGSSDVTINFTPNSPAKTSGQIYSLAYTVRINGSIRTTGTFNVTEEQSNTKVVNIGAYALNGDIVSVYLQYNA